MDNHTIFEKVTSEIHRYFSPKANIKHNQKLPGKSRVKRQIDVLIEDEIASYPLRIIVDCKYYSSKVDINNIDEVWGIVDDVKANLGVIVSNAGFTKGAIQRTNELGRLKLCSILDLENKKFSIKIALPVICEFRRSRYQVSIQSTDSNFGLLSSHPAYMFIEDKNGKISSIYNEFLTLWNSDKISHEVGNHVALFSPDEWKILGPNGRSTFNRLAVNYDVIPRFYVGLVPIIEGKGIVDIQEHALKTRGFTMDKIDVVDIERSWERFDRLEDIKTKPFMHLVASDLFKPIDLGIKIN